MNGKRGIPAKMRIDKWLAHMGVATRSELRIMAKRGVITVNGKAEKDTGRQVVPGIDQLMVDGQEVRFEPFLYIMMNKPKGVISATEDRRERTVLDLVPEALRYTELFPVGRLDKDTTGLLLLTDDGEMAHRLLSPKRHVAKTYHATIDGNVTDEIVQGFATGVTLDDGYLTLPGSLRVMKQMGDYADTEVIIHEGKFHQIKRMFQAFGLNVVELRRVKMGPLDLDESIPEGSLRKLTPNEIVSLEAVAFKQLGGDEHETAISTDRT